MKDHTIWERAHEAAARKYRATMSNGRGRLHEQMILAACRAYHDQGRANIIKDSFRLGQPERRIYPATTSVFRRANVNLGLSPPPRIPAHELLEHARGGSASRLLAARAWI